MKNTSIIKAILVTSLLAAAVISAGCGGGGGGGGSTSVSRGSMRLRLETPKEAYATATYTYTTSVAAAITVNSVAASGVSTAVASGTTSFTETCSSNSCSQSGGDFMITQIPPGTNYVVKAKLDLSTDSTVARQANAAYTYSYYYGALARSVADGVTTDVTVNEANTVVALAAMRYAQTKSVALSDVTAAAVSAISDYVAASQTLAMYSFHCASQTSSTCADPFIVSNWTTTFTAQLDAILANITVASTGCSAAATSYVNTAKSYIFKSSVSSTDFAAAKTAITSALAASPSCPDANIVSALLDIGTEADRVNTQVMASGTTIFPYTLGYTSPATVGKLAGSVVDPVLESLPRFAAAGTITSSSTPSDIQAATLASLTVLEGAITKLTSAKSAIAAAGSTTWSFSYPKDPANTALGSVSLDANDLDLIIGAIQFVTGYGYYAMSYNLDIPTSYSSTDPCPEYTNTWNGTSWTQTLNTSASALRKFNLCSAADVNNDKTITPAEYVPGPTTFGTRTTNGATYLAKAQTDISTGLTNMYTAVTNTLAEVSGTLGGVSITSQGISDGAYYKHYLSELAASFGGTTTNITMPADADCWKSFSSIGGTYYRSESVMDPAHNTTQLAGCLLQVQTIDPFTVPANFGALFSITDIRNVMPNYTIDSGGNVDSSIGTGTFGGVIPGGFQSSWFNNKTYSYYFVFQNMTNSTTSAVITNLPSTGVTLVIGGKTLTPTNSGGSSIVFARSNNPSTLPAATDYISINDSAGVTATLTVPGYQAKQFTIIGNYASPILSLTP